MNNRKAGKNTPEKTISLQYTRAKSKVAKWEKRYPNRPDIVSFLIRDDYLDTRAIGRKKFYREYLARPKQMELEGLPIQALPFQPELEYS